MWPWRRRTDTPSPAPVSAPRNDGAFTNLISGIGGARDKGSLTTVQMARQLSASDVENIYRAGGVGRILVDELPNDCTRLGWTVHPEDDQATEPWKAPFSRLKVPQQFREAHKLARLYGGAAVLLGIDDGRDPSEPVDLALVRRLVYLRVVDRYALTPCEWVAFTTADRLAQGAGDRAPGEPLRYTLSAVGSAAALYAPGAVKVHADRVLRFEGAEVPERAAASVSGWGDSWIQVAYSALSNFGMVEAGLASVIQDWSIFILKMKDLRAITRGPLGPATFATRLSDFQLSKSMINGVVLDADGESVDWLTRNVAGLADLFDRACRLVAMYVRMPATKLFGGAPGGLSTDDAAGSRNWYDQVAASQSDEYRPGIEWIVRLLEAARGNPTAPAPVVKFLPLQSPTAAEAAAIELTKAQKNQIYWQMHLPTWKIFEVEGLMSDDEIAALKADPGPDELPTTVPSPLNGGFSGELQ